jgi:DNA-binding response OmpR family regulator
MAGVLGEVAPTVLVVDSDRDVLKDLERNLRHDGFEPMVAATGEEALRVLREVPPDIALVEQELPAMSGLELLGTVREGTVEDEWDAGMPVVLSAAAPTPHAIVRGIQRGADDYVTKPVYYPELVARLGAALRRARGAAVCATLRVGPLEVDRNARRASVDGRRVPLSAKEFALLSALAKDPRRVMTKHELLRDVWGYIGAARTRTVDSHASRLRRKLAACGGGRFVDNVWGVGYRLLPDDS